MVATSTLNEASLYRFLEEHGDDQVKRELFLFWGWHPDAKFAWHIICYALDRGKLEVDRALRNLVKAGLQENHLSITTNHDPEQHPEMLLFEGYIESQGSVYVSDRRAPLRQSKDS